MADRVFFVASSPEEFFSGSVPPEMIDSLLKISRLPRLQLDQIGGLLQEADGFLDDHRLEDLVSQVVEDADTSAAIVDTIRNIRPRAIEETLQMLDRWRESDVNHRDRFPDDAFTSARSALEVLVRDHPALERHRKARRLSTFTGRQSRQIDFICDTRPVFDSDREEIEGFVTLTTMKIVYENPSNEVGSFELVLTPAQIERMIEKAQKALRKLESTAALIEEWMPGRVCGSVE